MKKKGRGTISFDTGHVTIGWHGREAFDLLNFLFKDNLRGSTDLTLVDFTLKAEKQQNFILHQGDKLLCQGEPGKVGVRLLDDVIYELAKETKGGLLFHAASLSRNGQSVLIPGKSGSGKTFLAANLADNNYSYHTDEITLVNTEDFQVDGFYKPLHVKDSQTFRDQIATAPLSENPAHPDWVGLPVWKGLLTNYSLCIPGKRPQRTKAALIIFPKYKSGAALNVTSLGCANTGLMLIRYLINARNLTSHGFHDISRLSRNVPAYTVTYGSSSQVITAINELLPL